MTRRPDLPEAAVAPLACPVCGEPLAVGEDGGVLRCPLGHSYDRARQGHVTLLPPGHRAPSGDSAEMVADRVAFLAAGHYSGISAALGDAVLDGGGAGIAGRGRQRNGLRPCRRACFAAVHLGHARPEAGP